MEMTREARSESEREMETRMNEDNWTFEEPDALAIPEVVKNRFADAGLALRWIRVRIKNNDDVQNVGKRLQDGWVFVEQKEVPEMMANSTVREEGRYTGTVSRGDLALAKMPMARALARKEFFENKSREMMDAVNSQLNSVNQNARDARERIRNNSRSQVTVGTGPKFQN